MWAQVIMMVLGGWLMVAPAVFGFDKGISDNAHIIGPLIATFSMVSLSEATRNVRFFNLPLAGWLLLAPWVLQYQNNTALFNDYAVAVMILLLAFIKPRRKNHFGGGWPAVWKSDTPHARKAGNPDRIQLRTGQRES